MADSGSETVLVVDDEEGIAELFTAYLAPKYEVRTAMGGEEALEKADNDVDVILLDRRMPRISGDEVLKEMTDRGIDAMVAMISGVDADIDILEMPIDAYLLKPAARRDIIELVETLIDRLPLDEDCRQYLALVSKKDALDATGKFTVADYRTLLDQLADLRDEIDGNPHSLEESPCGVTQSGT